MTSATNLGGEEYAAALASYVLTHPEKPLFAFVHQRITAWLAHVTPEESDKYLMLAAVNYVNCIAHVELPRRRPTRHPCRRRKAT